MTGDSTIPVELLVNAQQLELIDRFQRENDLPSRQEALVLLVDIALEAVTSKGRRFWDQPVASREPVQIDRQVQRAQELARRLRDEGHHKAAEQIRLATVGSRIGDALLTAVREACQTVLTTIEALDPKTALLAEELRLEIDKRLSR